MAAGGATPVPVITQCPLWRKPWRTHDIQIALPSGCYGGVAPRSGLVAIYFSDIGAGVIDEDYRGNIGVVLFNLGKEKFEVKKGDRIAQLICERVFSPEIEEVQVLDDTERGSGGFGSTGKN